MEYYLTVLQTHGVFGLFFLSFIESFCSPIIPDILLIPMSIANPDQALYYSLVVVAGSMVGGLIGYGLGLKLGLPLFRKIVPKKHIVKLRLWIEKYGAWAVFLSALTPIPYKFVCIGAGVFKVNFPIFFIASFLGRAKRFLLIGLLFHYYGEEASLLLQEHSNTLLLATLISIPLCFFLYKGYRYYQIKKSM